MAPTVSFAATTNFTDLNGHWAATIVQEANSRGIVNGYRQDDGTYLYKPDNLMTREEFFTMVVNVLSAQPDTSGVNVTKFCDVLPNEWYSTTVAKAVAAGITNGTTTKEKDGYDSFGVGLMITRQEAAKIVSSVIDQNKELTYDTMLAGQNKYAAINDSGSIAAWAQDHVQKLFVRGYMQGATNMDGTTSFNPTNALTRAEAATLLLNVVKGETRILGPNQAGAVVPVTTTPAITTNTAVTTPVATSVSGTIFTKSCGATQKTFKSERVDGSSKGCKCSGDDSFDEGSGRSNDPYVIRNADQLNHIREHADEGAYFILACDITVKDDYCKTVETRGNDWTSGNFEPIGTVKNLFDGSLDGNGYTISGLKIKGNNDGAGLIGYLDSEGWVGNLTIDDSVIEGGQYTGAIVGYSEGEITNCEVAKDVEVSGSYYVGGVVGYTSADVTYCVNRGKASCTRNSVGGVVGAVFGTGSELSNCANYGNVSGKEKVGGIAGSVAGTKKEIIVKNCTNEGTVESQESVAGGIVGEACKSSYEANISYCLNEGSVSGVGINGGIVGVSGSDAVVEYCYNKGTAVGNGAGGVIGENGGTLRLCVNSGIISADSYAGGLCGVQREDNAKIQQCYNSGSVSSKNMAGGIVGDNYKRVASCYNIGGITATVYAGGITGRNNSTIESCYNLGKVVGDAGSGQIVGLNKSVLSNVFWSTDNGSLAAGTTDTLTSQGTQKALTLEQLQGGETITLSANLKGTFLEVLNQTSGADTWVLVSAGTYPAIKGMFVK